MDISRVSALAVASLASIGPGRSMPGLRLGFTFFDLLYYNDMRKAIGGFPLRHECLKKHHQLPMRKANLPPLERRR
jgi:hypothetical protein